MAVLNTAESLGKLKELIRREGIAYQEGVDASRLSSIGTGGTIELLIVAGSEDELKASIEISKEAGLEPKVVGNCTNLIFRDGRICTPILMLGSGFSFFEIGEGVVRAGGALSLRTLVSALVQSGLSGLEWACGIPGSIGGAIATNAGAHGREVGDVLVEARIFSPDGRILRLDRAELGLGYRKSDLRRLGVLFEAAFRVERAEALELKKLVARYMEARRASQPVGFKSAGCVFKNPEGASAGQLVEAAGCKGMRIGCAEVSEKHANFIINRGGKRSCDVIRLIEAVRSRVFSEFGIELELEVEIVG